MYQLSRLGFDLQNKIDLGEVIKLASPRRFMMKKIPKTNHTDLLSQLPEEILEKIFYRLPTAEDAVRMSLVSKTWKSFWESLPQFHYRLDLKIGKNHAADSLTSEDDKTLSMLAQLGDPKRKIGAFQITRNYSSEEQRRRPGKVEAHNRLVDHWIKLVTKHYLLSLDISFPKPDVRYLKTSRYLFPCSPIDFGSLQRLCLSVCVLDKALVEGRTNLNCLKSLDLCYVKLNGIFWELLSKCPSLENLGVRHCGDPFALNYKVTAPKFVRTLRYASGSSETLDVDDIMIWKNLEVLHIETMHATISDNYMYNLTSAFPSLVELRLRTGYGSEPYLTVSSDQLKSLTIDIVFGIRGYANFSLTLKTPNLGYFSYKGPELIPSLNSQQDCMKVLKLNLRMLSSSPNEYRANSLGSRWFLAMRNFIGKLPQLEEFTLELNTDPTEIYFSPGRLKHEEIHPPSQVLDMSLHLPPLNIDLGSIGALLWISHPITLSMELNQYYNYSAFQNDKFIKFIYEEFMCLKEKAGKLRCCGNINSKCWRHYLKSVKLKSFYSIKDGQRYDEDSLKILADRKEGIRATFELQWLDT